MYYVGTFSSGSERQPGWSGVEVESGGRSVSVERILVMHKSVKAVAVGVRWKNTYSVIFWHPK